MTTLEMVAIFQSIKNLNMPTSQIMFDIGEIPWCFCDLNLINDFMQFKRYVKQYCAESINSGKNSTMY